MEKKASKISKIQLQELQTKLLKRDKKLSVTIEDLKSADPFLDPNHVSDNAAIDTDVREQMGHDTIEAQIKELKKEMALVHKALEKIHKGLYGVCEKCKKHILFERLKFLPYSEYCIDCEKKLRK